MNRTINVIKEINCFTALVKMVQDSGIHVLYARQILLARSPHNTLCLSLVSFNSTKRRSQSFIVSYIGYRFVIVCN